MPTLTFVYCSTVSCLSFLPYTACGLQLALWRAARKKLRVHHVLCICVLGRPSWLLRLLRLLGWWLSGGVSWGCGEPCVEFEETFAVRSELRGTDGRSGPLFACRSGCKTLASTLFDFSQAYRLLQSCRSPGHP